MYLHAGNGVLYNHVFEPKVNPESIVFVFTGRAVEVILLSTTNHADAVYGTTAHQLPTRIQLLDRWTFLHTAVERRLPHVSSDEQFSVPTDGSTTATTTTTVH